MTFGNLVTFEPLESREAHEDQYEAYERTWRGLPIAIAGTRDGIPAGFSDGNLDAVWAARVMISLGLADQPVRLLIRPLDDVAPATAAWVADFAAELGVPVYAAERGSFSEPLGDFVAARWLRFMPDPGRVVPELPDRQLPAGLAALRQAPVVPQPMPRYVWSPVSGLLMPESLEENPPTGRLGEAEAAWQRLGASLELLDIRVIVRDGRVRGLVLPGPAGPGMLPNLPETIPDGRFVVVAHGAADQVAGSLRRPGAVVGEAVLVPPAAMAGLIRAAEGYTAGMPVVFLVPALAAQALDVAPPERYVQQVANLLKTRVEATFEENPRGGLAAARRAVDPLRPRLEQRLEPDGRLTGLISLSSRLSVQDLTGAPSYPPDRPAAGEEPVQVFLPAFEDGSLGLYYSRPDGTGRAYSVTGRTVALELARVVRDRPVTIRPVVVGPEVSGTRLAAAIAEMRAMAPSATAVSQGLVERAAGEFEMTARSHPQAPVAGRADQEEMRGQAFVAGKLRQERLAVRGHVASGGAVPVRDRVVASLAAEGERLVPIRGDGFCFANALLAVAQGPLSAAGITTPQELHEAMASYLAQLEDWGDLEEQARLIWASERAGAGSGQAYDDFYDRAGTPQGRQEMHDELVGQLRQAGTWDTVGLELAPAVAARRFGLAITIVYANGSRHRLSGGAVQVTLVRSSDSHWDAAVPDDPPRPGGMSPGRLGGRTGAARSLRGVAWNGFGPTSPPAEVSAGEAARLSEESLRRVVAGLAGTAARSLAAGDPLAGCVEVVRGVLGQVYGRVRPAGVLDDGVLGLGGVAGVQQRMVAGAGWARVGSWAELERAVAQAGPGSSAVVLVSFAGDVAGHAVALLATGGEPRWVDPDGGLVTADRPAAVGRAVAAWAVLIGPEGQAVAEPGAWSAPESAAGAVVLADPPLRHDFGAMGVEVERHDIRLFLPGGEKLPEKQVLLRSRDGLVKVVVDNGLVWLGLDGLTYESPSRSGDGFLIATPVPETVTRPWTVLAEPGRPGQDEVMARVRDVHRRLEQARANRSLRPDRSIPLARLFPESDYEIAPEFRHVQVAGLGNLFDGAPLHLQVSVGVPLGGGVLVVLEEFLRGMDPESDEDRAQVGGALRFGWAVARHFAFSVTEEALSEEDMKTLTPDRDVVAVAEVMMLAFVQLSAVLWRQVRREVVMKFLMAVVPRQSLYELRAELEPQLRMFFADQADSIRELFEYEFQDFLPDFARQYSLARGLSAAEQFDLWSVDFSDEYTGEHIGTVGQLLDEILRPAPAGERIGPEVFDVGRADSGGLDRSRGSGPEMPLPLVVLELRSFGQSKYDPVERPGTADKIDDSMMMDTIGRVARAARAGDAAAEFARRLSASSEGQSVITRLRRAVAAPPGAGRDRAVRELRQAVGSYLARFPVQRPELEQALRPAAGRLGVSGGLAQADREEIGSSVRVRALLSAGHQVPDLELARVVLQARSLGMPARGEAAWLAGLAREIGLDHQDSLPARAGHLVGGAGQARRLFRLLALAASVFADGGSDREELANLRRLVDLIRAGRPAGGTGGAEVTLADLRAEFRRRYGLGGDVPVSTAGLRRLVRLTGQAKGVLPPGRPVTGRRLADAVRAPVPAVEATPSGRYVRAEGAGGYWDGPEDRAAALSFRPVTVATVVHVHADPVTGNLAVDGQLLTPEQFHQQVLVPLALPRGDLLVLVACGLGAARPWQEDAAARMLAELGDRPVLAASQDAFTTPEGSVVVGEMGADQEGRPVVRPGTGWTLSEPGRAEPVLFGPDLAKVLASPDLEAALPYGTLAPEVGEHQRPVRLPARAIRWSAAPALWQPGS